MNFCSHCGAPVEQKVPADDNRLRCVCTRCGRVHYQNPNIIAGCVPVWGDRVLLCKRAIEPRYGRWTVPAGFMENGESLEQAAARETLEEAGAAVNIGRTIVLASIPHINQVYVMFVGEMLSAEFTSGEESLETVLFAEQDIPWDAVAFPSITRTLQCFFADRRSARQRLHQLTILRGAR